MPTHPVGRRRLKRAIFELVGPDAARYLNGQLTVSTLSLPEGVAKSALLLNIKGKIEAEVFVRRRGESWIVDGEPDQRDLIHARLDRYLVADDVEIKDRTDEWELVHSVGVPGAEGDEAVRIGWTGRDWIGPSSEAGEGGMDAETWLGWRLAAGIPDSHEMAGLFPVETGREDQLVDFHKGCYTGQEVVSRIKKAGKVNRVLTLLQWDSEGDAPEAGQNGIETIFSTAKHPQRNQNLAFVLGKTR